MRVLVLDDNEHRHAVFGSIYRDEEVVHARTYSEFVASLALGPWDLLHLDHDLGEFQESADSYVDGWGKIRYYDGQHAVSRVLELYESGGFRGRVIVHSVNGTGGRVMRDALQRAGIPVVWEPFAEPSFEEPTEGA